MTLKGHLTQQASGTSRAYSHPLGAAVSFARDFSKNQTKNSDNTAQIHATQPGLADPTRSSGSWNETSFKVPFDPNHPGILTNLRMKLLKFKSVIYSTALSQGSRLHPRVHTPPLLLMLRQTGKEGGWEAAGKSHGLLEMAPEQTGKHSIFSLLSFWFLLVFARNWAHFSQVCPIQLFSERTRA